jgi:hypothetical protein
MEGCIYKPRGIIAGWPAPELWTGSARTDRTSPANKDHRPPGLQAMNEGTSVAYVIDLQSFVSAVLGSYSSHFTDEKSVVRELV